MQVLKDRGLSCPTTLVLAAATLLAVLPDASAQERYDDHELDDRLSFTIGGYHTTNIDSTRQVDANSIGLGTMLDAEDLLRVDRSVTIARLDGYRRFNRASHVEWTYFDQIRNGAVALEDDIDVGNVTFPVGYRLDTRWGFRLIKAAYAWSFINTARYEFYLGAGLNVRTTSLRMRGRQFVSGQEDVRTFRESATLPLPSVSVGLRHRVRDRLTFNFGTETFFLKINGSEGRLGDDYLLVTTESVGTGACEGVSISTISFSRPTSTVTIPSRRTRATSGSSCSLRRGSEAKDLG